MFDNNYVFIHMFVQSYDSKFLKIYPELQPTPLQLEEDLEQLKVLENGYKMKVLYITLTIFCQSSPTLKFSHICF